MLPTKVSESTPIAVKVTISGTGSVVLVTSTSALVTWDTDEPATSFVEWGPTAGYGDSLSDGALVTAHALLVTGLDSGSEYHFRVCSTDLARRFLPFPLPQVTGHELIARDEEQ